VYVEKTLAVRDRLPKLNGWSCNSQLWHPRRLGCNYLFNARRLWKGVVAAHATHPFGVQHQRWMVVI